MKEKKVYGLSDKQRKQVLKVRARSWDKPVSLWKKMNFIQNKVSFRGKK